MKNAEWKDFAVFREWCFSNGYNDTLTLDRLNSDGNYCPENCEWVTRSENARRVSKPMWAIKLKEAEFVRLEKEKKEYILGAMSLAA